MAAGIGREAPRNEAGVAHCTVRAPCPLPRSLHTNPNHTTCFHFFRGRTTERHPHASEAHIGGYLRHNSCKEHGDQETHYCSNSKFFKDAMSYATPPKGATHDTHTPTRAPHLSSLIVCRGAPVPEKSVADIEDFQAKININPTAENFPLVARTPPAHSYGRDLTTTIATLATTTTTTDI